MVDPKRNQPPKTSKAAKLKGIKKVNIQKIKNLNTGDGNLNI